MAPLRSFGRCVSLERRPRTLARPVVIATKARGTTLIEVLVAFGLLATLIGVLMPTLIRHGRFRQALCHERLAMDELSNQLDILSMAPASELPKLVARLEPSEVVRESLKGVRLTATLDDADDAMRITLKVTWDAPGRRDNPLQLAAWRYPVAEAKGVEDSGADGVADSIDQINVSRSAQGTGRRPR